MSMRSARWINRTSASIDGDTLLVVYKHHFVRDELNRGEWFNCVKYNVISARSEQSNLADEWLTDTFRLLKKCPRILVAQYDFHSAHLYDVVSSDIQNRMLYVTFADKPIELVRLPHDHDFSDWSGRGWTPWGWKDWRDPIDGHYVGKVRGMLPREKHFAKRESWPQE
ncbi:hypothetical protein [Sphingomonas sp. S6]|jgi:hypothetical protein|uniref:hypothetical protein n=1 Tax=Sphingomonas sp. S6 TaxID=3368600 RepID=UPI0028EA4FD4|nr:hypothetical protein [uncultured Sphingomonas sp.]